MDGDLIPMPAAGNAVCQVVLIHGLAGDGRKTWTHENDALWPEWLTEDLPADVWLANYPASPTRWTRARPMALRERAVNLLSQLDTVLDPALPVVFVGHSLGGLIAKQMLKHSDTMGDVYAHLARQTAGVVFLASPHDGAMLATYLDRIAALSRPTKLIHDLKHANDPLIETGDWFRNWVTRTGIPTVTFYEISPYKGTFIVDRRSADPSTPGRPAIPLDADHVSIAKFSDRGVAAYQQIVKFIRDAIVARTGPSPTNAPHLRRPSVSPASDSLAELWAAAARSSSDADLVEPALQTLRLNVRITAAKRAGENATELRRSGEAVLSAVRSRLRAVASPPVLGIDVINIVPLTSVDEGATTEDIAVRAFKSASRLGGDGARVIHEAVAELVDNLVEHARGRGYVAVTFDKTTDLVTVIVGDSGVGLLRSMAQRGAMTDREAILFAAEIGSRMADPGRGQGLPHMITTAIIYGGAFSLATGSTQITYSHAGREYRDLPDSVRVNGTLARLILPYAQLLQGRADQVSARRPRPSDAVVEAKLPRFVSSRRQAADLVKALGDLRGATVVLVPDKDEAVAISAGHEVLRALEEAGVAAVRITNPPPWWKQYLSDAATNGRYTMQIVIE